MKSILLLLITSISLFTYSQNISSVTPNSGYTGTYSLPVMISGVNTNFDQATYTYIEFNQATNSYLNISEINSITSNSINVNLQIHHNVDTGFYDVNYYGYYPTGLEHYTAYSAFNVATSTLNPSIIMSSPQTVVLDQPFNFNVATNSTNFLQATNTSAWFSQGTSTSIFPNTSSFNTNTSFAGTFILSSSNFMVGDTLDFSLYNYFDGMIIKQNAITISSSNAISGTVYDPNSFPTSCTVELYQQIESYNSQSSFIFVNSTFSSDGNYQFNNIPNAQFVIRALPSALSGLSAAYYSSVNQGAQLWDDAEIISSTNATTYNIYLNDVSDQSGTGSVSGTVTSEEGLTKQLFPIENARITCYTGNSFYETYSDNLGSYVISGLPYDTYTLVVDIPGKTQPSVSTVTISSENETITDNDYLVYQDFIIQSFQSIDKRTIDKIAIYPNPTKDYVNFELQNTPIIPIQLKIFDSKGVMIKQVISNDKVTQIDISTIANGKYYLAGIVNGRLCVSPIIKQ